MGFSDVFSAERSGCDYWWNTRTCPVYWACCYWWQIDCTENIRQNRYLLYLKQYTVSSTKEVCLYLPQLTCKKFDPLKIFPSWFDSTFCLPLLSLLYPLTFCKLAQIVQTMWHHQMKMAMWLKVSIDSISLQRSTEKSKGRMEKFSHQYHVRCNQYDVMHASTYMYQQEWHAL